jgi:ribosomal protein S18 acetylase RimI-like enzyme
MSEATTIRRATAQDLPALAILFDLYRQFYQKASDVEGARRFLAERIRNEESVIFVAESAQAELYGFAQLYPTFTSLGMARAWTLNDLYVVTGARRVGIGRLLMQAVDQLALATGARLVALETHVENTTAQALYAGFGYHAENDFRIYSKGITPRETVQ